MAIRWMIAAALLLAACAPDFTAIKERCASDPDPAPCEQRGYDAYYAVERAKLRRIGGD